MGDAKRRRRDAEALAATLPPAVERVSGALRRLAIAASSHLGSDCYLHVELGRLLLADLGIEATPVVGYAAWRVGVGDGDVISHIPMKQGYLPAGTQGFAYHGWLTVGDYLIDFTTYQLRKKAADLDAADGGHTTVDWCPEVLLTPKTTIKTYREVAQSFAAGVFYYEAQPELLKVLAETSTLDPEDLAAARLLLSNPQLQVVGPNDVPG